MGQYHYICNKTKHEYLNPHGFGDGLKLMEFGMSMGGTMTALAILLSCSNGRGGGDARIDSDHPLIEVVGSWAGDEIAIIGDYTEEGDIAGWDSKNNPWHSDDKDNWADISAVMRELIEADGEVKFENDEWILRGLDGKEEKRTSIIRVDA